MKNIIFGVFLLTTFCLSADGEPAPGNRLPHVLLIGDSISKGYTPYVIEMMEGQAVVTRNNGNAGPTMRGLENIEEWLAAEPWDVIHFNWGLHDMYRWNYLEADRSPSAYEKRLDTLVQRLKETGAKLIWATTTPACVEAEKKCKVKIDPVIEEKYQQAALRVMKKHKIQINDLYAFIRSQPGAYSIATNDVHYTQEGSKKLAEQVVTAIKPLLDTQVSIEVEISSNVADYQGYQTANIFSVNAGSVKVKPFNDLGWHIVVIPDQAATTDKVSLKMSGASGMEGYTLSPWKPKYDYWRKVGDWVEVDIMPEGWGWYFLRKPEEPASLQRVDPDHMISAQETVIKKAKYQDRILFGQDGTKTVDEYRKHFRFLETDDDLIIFSRNRPPVYGLKLPDEVLRKLYYGNAAKLMPRVKTAVQNQYPELRFP